MTEEEFWKLIEKSREESGECEAQAAALAWLLSAQPAGAIQSFDDIFAAKRADAYRWDLWGAAYLINGGMLRRWIRVFPVLAHRTGSRGFRECTEESRFFGGCPVR